MQEINLRNYAYLGDAIWELYIRERTILRTNNAKKLHQITTKLVNTHFQFELLHFLEDKLNEEELDLVKRARNLPIPVGRRNIQNEYRQATAFETLVGWWYSHNKSRYDEMMALLEAQLEY